MGARNLRRWSRDARLLAAIIAGLTVLAVVTLWVCDG